MFATTLQPVLISLLAAALSITGLGAASSRAHGASAGIARLTTAAPARAITTGVVGALRY